MKKEIFTRIMAITLIGTLGFQPFMVYGGNIDFTSGTDAVIGNTAAGDTNELFSDDSDIVTFSAQPTDTEGFGDGTAEVLLPEETEDAAGVSAGNSIANATEIELGQSYSGSITETNQMDFYKFTLNSSGNIELDSVARIPKVEYALYDASGKSMWNNFYTANSSGQSSIEKTFDLTSGTYYLGIQQSSNKTGSYDFEISFSSADETFAETGNGNNNTIAEADDISLGNTYKGQIAYNDEKDFYKFTLTSSGRITLSSTAVISKICYRIYDSTGNNLWTDYNTANTSGQVSVNKTFDLTQGTYYLGMEQSVSHTGTYSFNLSFSGAGETFTETGNGNNNTIAEADDISLDITYKGQIALNDTADFYELAVDAPGKYSLTSTSSISKLYYRIYDGTGNCLWYKSYSAGTGGNISVNETLELAKGIYYLGIEKNGSNTGNYSFKISPLSVIPTDYTGLHEDEGVYRYYVKGEWAETHTGVVEFEGRRFYVVNGIVASKVSGLIMFDNTWYYLNYGEVAGYTGTVLYNNSWFYVKNGVLDTSMNGLVSYNGGKFLFIGGYLADNVSGLWLSPEDEWYYLSMGQALTNYTGVVMYDSEFFYIRNGKLASDYNGTVTYNGGTFKVSGGQLYGQIK
ncbi:MAG TPA: hypothetical protein IAA26_07965 [Candidatus Blautia faecipullorum]|nr:hypothetical protein [Candidatus Blautia faecipullorum]